MRSRHTQRLTYCFYELYENERHLTTDNAKIGQPWNNCYRNHWVLCTCCNTNIGSTCPVCLATWCRVVVPFHFFPRYGLFGVCLGTYLMHLQSTNGRWRTIGGRTSGGDKCRPFYCVIYYRCCCSFVFDDVHSWILRNGVSNLNFIITLPYWFSYVMSVDTGRSAKILESYTIWEPWESWHSEHLL